MDGAMVNANGEIAALVAALTCMGLASCSTSTANPAITIFNPELRTAYASYADSWRQQRTELEFDGGHRATDCASYLELFARHDMQETMHNQQVHSEYLPCDVLKLLGSGAKVESVTAVTELGARLAKGLDLRSFSSSLNQRSDADRHTLSSLDPSHLKIDGSTVVLEDEGWHFSMEVVALADVNGNGVADWIVWMADEAKLGTFRAYFTVLVLDPGEKPSFSGSDFPSLADDSAK